MYDITELVYGFDFSDGKYPDLGINLNIYILNHIIYDDPFENPYTGYCEKPCYLGILITDYCLDDNIFDILKQYEKILEENKEKYDIEIKNKIDEVISGIKESKKYIMNGNNSLTNYDFDKVIEYFNDLKLCEPQKCSIKTTS